MRREAKLFDAALEAIAGGAEQHAVQKTREDEIVGIIEGDTREVGGIALEVLHNFALAGITASKSFEKKPESLAFHFPGISDSGEPTDLRITRNLVERHLARRARPSSLNKN